MKKIFDLETRTQIFTKNIISLVRNLDSNVINTEISKQLVRSAGSVGANYIEANESLSKKDFHYRIKICLKEAKETRYWLLLLTESNTSKKIQLAINESTELIKIFSSIAQKTL